MLTSNCCDAAPKTYNDDIDSMDLGICPCCGEHCDFIDDNEEDDNE